MTYMRVPHFSTQFFDYVANITNITNIYEYASAWLVFENLACYKGCYQGCWNNLSFFIYKHGTVGIAVYSDADIGMFIFYFLLKALKCFMLQRICLMRRKCTIEFKIHFYKLRAKSIKHIGQGEYSHSICRISDYFQI